MISLFDEPFVNDTRIEDNLFSINPFEDISNNYDNNEDIYPFLGGDCDFYRENYTNSNTVINEQGNNHTNNNQINSIINNNNNITNSLIIIIAIIITLILIIIIIILTIIITPVLITI